MRTAAHRGLKPMEKAQRVARRTNAVVWLGFDLDLGYIITNDRTTLPKATWLHRVEPDGSYSRIPIRDRLASA